MEENKRFTQNVLDHANTHFANLKGHCSFSIEMNNDPEQWKRLGDKIGIDTNKYVFGGFVAGKYDSNSPDLKVTIFVAERKEGFELKDYTDFYRRENVMLFTEFLSFFKHVSITAYPIDHSPFAKQIKEL